MIISWMNLYFNCNRVDEHVCNVESLDFVGGTENFSVLRKDDLCGGSLCTGTRDLFHFFHASFTVLGASVADWRVVSPGVDAFVNRVFFFSDHVAPSVHRHIGGCRICI